MPPPIRDLGEVAVTGHRPQGLDDDFSMTSPLWEWIAAHLDRYLWRATRLRCGMALGVDLLAAERAMLMEVPFDAYLPCEGQAERWGPDSRRRYARVLASAERRILVSEGPCAPWKMHARNEAMLTGAGDSPLADALISVWTGKRSGGTYHATMRAETLGVQVLRIDPSPWLG